jgi:hypothetical protein
MGALTLDRLQKAIADNPDILNNRALAGAVAEAEAEEAKQELAPFVKALDAFITKSQADGKLTGKAVEHLPLVSFELERDEKTEAIKGVKVIVSAVATKRGSSGPKISSNTWKAAGFQTFIVNGSEVAKPKDAIVAAGGKPRKVKSGKNAGQDANENYWRVILDNGDDGFVNLPIKVRVAKESGDTETIGLKDMKARVNA